MSTILRTAPLNNAPQWPAADPFLFIAHHLDAYPEGTSKQTPRAGLDGRELGMDFAGKDGWNMYHGRTVPGFPQHPHQGFETVTVVLEGLVDHTDSAGATARYGEGDTQWLTAGSGIAHSEMFPLVHQDRPNPLHLFQIWLNLAPEDKKADANFSMLWGPDTPTVTRTDAAGRKSRIRVVAGALDGQVPPPPPPASWAARPDSEVAIWIMDLEPGADLTLPATKAGVTRTLYVYDGSVTLDGTRLEDTLAVVSPQAELALAAGEGTARILLLQARPIGAPVVQHGPFVANTRDELVAAFTDYQAGRFGRWTLDDNAPVHPAGQTRFARYPDGTVTTPAGS